MPSIYETEKNKQDLVKISPNPVSEKTDKAWDWFKASLWDIFIGLSVLIYVGTGLVQITETGRTVWEILATGGTAFVFGVTINLLFAKKGLIKGETHPEVLKTNEDHDAAYEKILPYVSKGDEWCELENKAAIKIVRERILSKAALSYKDYFNEDGTAKDADFSVPKDASKSIALRVKAKEKAYNDALNANITYLTISDLISLRGNVLDPNDLGRSKTDYEKKTLARSALDKIIPSVIVGYFSVQMIADVGIGNLIWTAFQSILFVIMGYLKYLNSFYFIADEDRQNTKKKIAYLTKFHLWIQNEVINRGRSNDNYGDNNNPGTISKTEGNRLQPATESIDRPSQTISTHAENSTPTELERSEERLSTNQTPSPGGLLPTE